MSNEEIYQKLYDLINTPYKIGSLDPKEGLDCLTFIIHFYTHILGMNLNIDIPRYSTDWYKDKPATYYLNAVKYCDLKKYKGQYIEPYSILCFSIEGRPISHMGIYFGNNQVIHCVEDKGVTIHKLSLCRKQLSYIAVIKESYHG